MPGRAPESRAFAAEKRCREEVSVMLNFTYYAPTNVIFGKDTEQQAGSLCAQYGASRVLIHYGGGSAVRSGLIDRVKDSLEKDVPLAVFCFR